jgi:hypothetical protein
MSEAQGAVYLTRVLMDETSGIGINLEYLNYVFGKDLYTTNTSKQGIVLTGVSNANLVNVVGGAANGSWDGITLSACKYINLANGIGAMNLGAAGLRIINGTQYCHVANVHCVLNAAGLYLASGCNNIQFANLVALENTGSGVSFVDSFYCRIINGVSVNNSVDGFVSTATTGTCDGNVYVDLKANGNGSFSFSSPPSAPNTAVADWIPADGVFRPLDTPGANGIKV